MKLAVACVTVVVAASHVLLAIGEMDVSEEKHHAAQMAYELLRDQPVKKCGAELMQTFNAACNAYEEIFIPVGGFSEELVKQINEDARKKNNEDPKLSLSIVDRCCKRPCLYPEMMLFCMSPTVTEILKRNVAKLLPNSGFGKQ